MVMGVGLHGPAPAMFHLTTHAFFKALLFLGAGSVILALHHEQDIWKMGGLRSKMPTTFWTFLAGTLALAGVLPFSGFYSKDSILALAWEHNPVLFALGAAVVVLTAFYMFRVVFVVFGGEPRSEASGHAHESPSVITWPLTALAVFSAIGGFIGIENVYRQQSFLGSQEGIAPLSTFAQLVAPFREGPWAAALGLLAAAIGIAAAYSLYARAKQDPLPEKLGSLSRAMQNRFYFDELYAATVIRFHDGLAAFASGVDCCIGGAVRLTHGTTELTGRALRLMQTGNVQDYAFLFTLGVVVVLFLMLVK
jgi:NADH-quinone oxidoreductase subunit L